MNATRTLCAVTSVLLTSLAGLANASDEWYMGTSASHYNLDSSRAQQDHHESNLLGLQAGRYLTDHLAVELGYAQQAGHDDLDALSLNGVLWLGDKTAGWAPFALLGVNQYDFNNGYNLAAGHDDSSTQLMFGLGIAKRLSDKFDLRADVRLLSGHDEDAEDVGFHISLNRIFGTPTPPPVIMQPAAMPEPQVQPKPEPKMRTVVIRLDVKFAFDQAVVLSLESEDLNTVAAAMRAHSDILLVLEGHTDSTGSEAYNLDLSTRRAAAVKDILIADYGIDAGRISARGFGESHPIDSNQTRAGRKTNRRVVGEMTYTEVVVD